MGDAELTWNIRWERDDEWETARAVMRETWESAYARIFTPDEIAGVFEGQLKISNDYGVSQEHIGALVAEMGGKIVGVAVLALLPDDAGEVVALYVKPACQGRGIGRALWDGSMEVFKERGCVEAQVWVLAQNAPAIRFYERQGCVLMGEGEFAVGKHEERVLGYRVDVGSA
jgi:ribosomal protein S18 acetylase RimI-like enzyme